MDVKKLLSEMTLHEKASMISGADFWHLDEITRLDIPSIMVSDGPHGLRKQNDKADNLGVNESIKAVCFPTAVGTASSFNKDLIFNLGKILGNECQAENVAILLGPAVNIKRSPLCGRNFEYFSEDPFLTGELATHYIKGVQSQSIGTSVKHFAVNNQEKRRATVSVILDERTMREIYLRSFEMCIKEAKPWTIMCSYNRILGEYSSENNNLLNKILRDEWGFNGYVMSDWGAVHNRVKGLKNGLELEMPSSGSYNTDKIIAAVEKKELTEQSLDTACERILMATNRYLLNKNESAVFNTQSDHEKARAIACECMVLLKNNGILPLSKNKKLAFIGEFAEKPRYQGGGSSNINAYKTVSALTAAKDILNVVYSKGFYSYSCTYDEKMAINAINTAQAADIAVIFAGLPDFIESEGFDRKDISLPSAQNKLIEEIAKVQPNTVVVLHNGSAVLMPWLNNVSAVLEAYLGGEAVGEAVLDLLTGLANPSAKLAETFPLSLEDTPSFGNFPGTDTVEYKESIYVGYRYYDKVNKNVLFPFGYGLSYTSFEYSNFNLKEITIQKGEALHITFSIKNIGLVAGAEIAQTYVSLPENKAFHAKKALVGFEKVYLEPNEQKIITITIKPQELEFYNIVKKDWDLENGEYTVSIGSSSKDIKWQQDVSCSAKDNIVYKKEEFETYYSGKIQQVSDEEFQKLLGFKIPRSSKIKSEKFTLTNTLEDAQNTRWGKIIIKLLIKKKPNFEDGLDNQAMMQAMLLETPIDVAITMGLLTEQKAQALVSLWNNEKQLTSLICILKGGIIKKI